MPPEAWLGKLAGRFLVFDGPDGSGKSTQFRRFAQSVEEAGVPVCQVREPGGTDIGEQIRAVLLDTRHEKMDLRCEMLLYMASRAQLLAEKIRPALAAGHLVLADRFISSTLAYQGAAGGLDTRLIHAVAEVAVGGTRPDLTVIFDVNPQVAAVRMAGTASGGKKGKTQVLQPTLFSDRIELKSPDYHARVREGYLQQARDNPAGVLVIDASPDPETVYQSLCSALQARLES